MKNIRDIIKHIAKEEGKKHQASVGDIREIVSIISDLVYSHDGALVAILCNGQTRFKRKKKK